MSVRSITPAPAVAVIITGHFRETQGYATWRPRGTEDFLLMFTVGGSGRISHAHGETFTMPGDAILIRPNTPHDYGTVRGASGWELLWAHFRPRSYWREWLAWPEVASGVGRVYVERSSEPGQRVEAALQTMVQRSRTAQVRREDFAMNALEEALLWCDVANPNTARAGLDPRVVAAMEFLLERIREPVSVADAAHAVNLSVSRLAHLFQAQVGETPQQFVERERISRAQQLLTLTGRTVAAIAEEVGYASPFYFTLRFKKRTGFSPRAWREGGDRRQETGDSGE